MCVRLGLSYELKDTGWRYMRVWCSWQYFGSKTEEIGRGRIKLHYDELRALYSTVHHTLFALHKNVFYHWHLFGPFPFSLYNTTQCFGSKSTLIHIHHGCVVSCCGVLCPVVLCRVVLCRVVLCCVVLCRVVSCCVVLCCVVLWQLKEAK
jgi:hypothetical protein